MWICGRAAAAASMVTLSVGALDQGDLGLAVDVDAVKSGHCPGFLLQFGRERGVEGQRGHRRQREQRRGSGYLCETFHRLGHDCSKENTP